MTTTDNNEDNDSNKDDTTARASSSSSSSSKWDRNASKFITIIGFAVNLVNYLDRAVIGAAAGQIISEFQLSSSQFGWLAGSFGFGALLSNLFSGFLLDRVGVRYVWTIAIVAWSATMLGQAYVEKYAVFIVVRILMGIAEGVNFMAMDRSHADYIPGRRGSFAMSLSLLGVFLAFVIGYPIFGHTVPKFGWRTTFIGLAILGFGAAVVLLAVYREQDKSKKQHSEGIGWIEETKILLSDITFVSVCWSFGTFGYTLGMSVVWLPTYLQQTRTIGLGGAALFGMVPWSIASILMVFVALLSDYILVKTESRRKSQIYPIAACQFLSLISFIPLLIVGEDNGTAALVCVSLGIGIGLANNAPYYTFCNMRFPPFAAAATGLMVSFFTTFFTCAPFLTGYVMDSTSSFAGAFGIVVGLLGTALIFLVFFAFPDKENTHVSSLQAKKSIAETGKDDKIPEDGDSVEN